MYRSLLNSTPTLGVFALIMGWTTLFAIALSLGIRAIYPKIASSHYGEASTAIRGTFALLYGLIFALSIGNLSAKNSQASATAATESVALAQMVRGAGGLPTDVRVPVRQSIRDYTRAVVEDEWKTLEQGKPSVRVSTALDNMYATYQSFVGKPAPTGALATAGLSKLDQVTASRRTRLDLSQQGLPVLLRALLILGVILFIVLSFPNRIYSRSIQMLVMGGIAAFLAFSFSLTVILDYPFSGDQSVKNDVYQQGVLAQFFAPATAPPLADLRLDSTRLTNNDLVGEWTSAVSKNGVIVFREVNGELHGAYRADNGGFVGRIEADGVLRGWWCEEPSRQPGKIGDNDVDAGDVEWRLLKTKSGGALKLDGRWRYSGLGDYRGGWTLEKVATVEPFDLAAAFDDASRFCPRPGSALATTGPATITTPTTRPTQTTLVKR